MQFLMLHFIEFPYRYDTNQGLNGYQIAEIFGNTEVVNLIKTKMPSLVV